jgi:hypothetical protein
MQTVVRSMDRSGSRARIECGRRSAARSSARRLDYASVMSCPRKPSALIVTGPDVEQIVVTRSDQSSRVRVLIDGFEVYSCAESEAGNIVIDAGLGFEMIRNEVDGVTVHSGTGRNRISTTTKHVRIFGGRGP